MPGFFTVVLIVLGLVLAQRDPRRLLPGVLLAIAASSLMTSAVNLVFDVGVSLTGLIAGLDQDDVNLVGGLIIFALPLLAVPALGVTLVLNGVTMLRRERRSPANMLSLLLGVAVLGAFVVGMFAMITNSGGLLVVMLLLSLPVAYLGSGFVAYLAWSLVYARIARRAPAPGAVVVLGAGLVQGRVSPLLAQRVALGVKVQDEQPTSVLVLSGGQGRDEPRSEGEAMAEHARELGASAERILVENASTSTETNLTLSRALLGTSGIDGPVLAVTNDYHAFRAAGLLRRLGIPGHAIGARTARYYLPSALLREYIALLRDHRVLNAIALAVLTMPIAAFILLRLLG